VKSSNEEMLEHLDTVKRENKNLARNVAMDTRRKEILKSIGANQVLRYNFKMQRSSFQLCQLCPNT
jgi:uncharacterized Rmd1/YagE family protein